MCKKKFYAVSREKYIGIFDNWEQCSQATLGYSGNKYKSFKTIKEAQQYIYDDIGVWIEANKLNIRIWMYY